MQRRFATTATLQDVWDIVHVHIYDSEMDIERFTLSTNYPRKTYGTNDLGTTIEDAGLSPQGVLFVNDEDA